MSGIVVTQELMAHLLALRDRVGGTPGVARHRGSPVLQALIDEAVGLACQDRGGRLPGRSIRACAEALRGEGVALCAMRALDSQVRGRACQAAAESLNGLLAEAPGNGEITGRGVGPGAQADLRHMAAELYQAAGAYDMPERVLDVLADMKNGDPIRHQSILPVRPPGVGD
ncbi:hypothetical protein J2T57_001470 [Natronocella acetinitrilica]|uniref:Uncharacterized protein n=1 Tax=Natronocella acetinitrilica TaxID=414046 RepID=A0AAE3G4Q8_9GAMM|nr:hypothetical protein [Natronocella acetinitrilica]MCP1674368.1 hypothetical protein [Natronocella acetinitrilica]